ncbi:hypothetical protein SERLA73DRAFT_168420, partial [Serpula lacrymans var. lacrymans S7.3]
LFQNITSLTNKARRHGRVPKLQSVSSLSRLRSHYQGNGVELFCYVTTQYAIIHRYLLVGG